MSLDEWRATQAPPFEAGIDAGAELVMFGHLRYTAVDSAPATLSAAWHELLRDELGFDGIIVTDDLSMLQHSGDPAYADQVANAVAAVAAGNTLLLYVGPVDVAAARDAIVAAVADGRIDEATDRRRRAAPAARSPHPLGSDRAVRQLHRRLSDARRLVQLDCRAEEAAVAAGGPLDALLRRRR